MRLRVGDLAARGRELGGLGIDLGEIEACAQGGGNLARTLEEPGRRVEVALHPQGGGGHAVERRLLEAVAELVRLARGVDRPIEGGVYTPGGEIELAQTAPGLKEILSGAELLEAGQALLVGGACGLEIALAKQGLAAVAEDLDHQMGAAGMLGDVVGALEHRQGLGEVAALAQDVAQIVEAAGEVGPQIQALAEAHEALP